MNIPRLLLSCGLALGLLGAAASMAQQSSGTVTGPAASAPPSSAGHGHGMMSMLRELNLTAAQMQQIKQIHDQYRQAHPAGSQPDAQAAKGMRQSVLNVLTPAQRAQFQAKVQALRGQGQPTQDSAQPPAQQPSSPPG